MKLRDAQDPAQQPRGAAYLCPGPDTRLEDEFDDIHELLAPFGFYSAVLGMEIWVPAGFRTDFASVPRVVGAFLLFGGKGKRAAVIHDWLYSGGIDGVTRTQADLVFKEALAASTWTNKDGVVKRYSQFTIGAMYAGVHLGGESRWTAPNVPQPAHVEVIMGAAALEAA